jgi:phospholipid/cholesterol/gamma-HCH transport system permease protein
MPFLEWIRERLRGGSPPVSTEETATPSPAEDLISTFSVDVGHGSCDELHLNVTGSIHMANAEKARKELLAAIDAEPLKNVVLDLTGVDYFDSSGVAILLELRRECSRRGNLLNLVNVGDRVQGLMSLADLEGPSREAILEPRPLPNLLVQIGDGVLKVHATARDSVTFIGAVITGLWRDLQRPGRLKWDPVWKLIERSGSDAVPIVSLLSFLMGAILAYQSANQLRKFGATLFVADLVSISICLEMGPLLTALIVAGRSGASYAAHIGTMQVTEEIDALKVMAMDPVRYLVSPRVLALAVVTPFLTLFADMLGIIGGLAVAVLSLDVTSTQYINQVAKVLEVDDILKGLCKSLAFGIEIAIVGCLRGFQVRGGAESVGAATTSAVVTSIFVIVITDAVFAVLFHYFRLV